MKKYRLDGSKITCLASFFNEFAAMVYDSAELIKKFGDAGYFGTTLELFDDSLFGGFGLKYPCEITWADSHSSKKALGYELYAKWCREQIDKKNYLDDEGLDQLIAWEKQANEKTGDTMFDVIVDMISSVKDRSHDSKTITLILK